MKVKVLFFGFLNEKTGTSTNMLEDVRDLNELIERLQLQFPSANWQTKYLIAVNHEVVRGNITLNDGDEIALMPPFAGG
ncbi:MAG: MoaD/ThiS family protein [Bacteroidetes bacterium]|nr:MoaD/ThiS family protein [Bacteroidota bacterium]